MDGYQPASQGLFLPVAPHSTYLTIYAANEVWFALGDMTMAEHAAILGMIFSVTVIGQNDVFPENRRPKSANGWNGSGCCCLQRILCVLLPTFRFHFVICYVIILIIRWHAITFSALIC